MTIRDIDVVITRETRAVTQAGFGMPLILATSQEQEYTEYEDLSAIAEDFAETSEEYKLANREFAQTPRPQKIAIAGILYGGADTTELTSFLNDLVAAGNDDWYFLTCPEQGDEEITALSEWIDAQKKIYFSSTSNDTLPATLESDRTVLLVHKKPETYPAEGWVGRCAPENPGSITWKFKTINGIEESGFSTAELSQIDTDGGNFVVRQGGVLHTAEGKTTSGEFIDIIRSQDFLEARIKENVFAILVNASKIPFTTAGINQTVSGLEAALRTAFANGIIAADDAGEPLYTIEAPTRSEVPTNDRANRILPDVNFEVELAGAIHKTRISGVLSV